MRKLILAAVIALTALPVAADTYTVGNKIVADGDSAGKLVQLLGKPDAVIQLENKYGAAVAERWEYYRDGKTIQFVVAGGVIREITEIR